MNILLIEPPAVSKFGNQRVFGGNGANKSEFRRVPLDLMMISGYLRKEGIDSAILDVNGPNRSIADVTKSIKQHSPHVILFSTSTATIYSDLLVYRFNETGTYYSAF